MCFVLLPEPLNGVGLRCSNPSRLSRTVEGPRLSIYEGLSDELMIMVAIESVGWGRYYDIRTTNSSTGHEARHYCRLFSVVAPLHYTTQESTKCIRTPECTDSES